MKKDVLGICCAVCFILSACSISNNHPERSRTPVLSQTAVPANTSASALLNERYHHTWAGYIARKKEGERLIYDLLLTIKEDGAILTGVKEQRVGSRSPELLNEPPQAAFSARFDYTLSDRGVALSSPEWIYRTGTAMDDRLLDAFDQINLTYHDSLGGDRHAYMIEVAQTPVAGILSSNDVLGCTVDADGDTFQMSLALLDSVGYDSLYPAWEEHYAESAKVRSFWFSAEANSNGWRWQGIVYQDNQGNEYLRYFDSLTSSNSSKFASGTFTLQSRYLDGYYWDQRYMLDAQTGGFIKMQPPIESFTLFDFDWPYQPYGEYHDIEDHMEQHQGKWTGYIDLASDTTKLIVEPEIHVQLDIKNTTAVLSFTEAGNSFSGETFHFDCDPVWEALRMRRTDSVELAAEQVQNILWITFYYYHAHDFDLDTHFIVDDLAPDGDASKSVLYGVVFNEEKQEIARITLSKHSTSTEELSERNTNDLSIK